MFYYFHVNFNHFVVCLFSRFPLVFRSFSLSRLLYSILIFFSLTPTKRSAWNALNGSTVLDQHHIRARTLPTNKQTYHQYSLLQTAIEACQKKTKCKFIPAPKSFGGGSCPGSRKVIEYTYKCRPCK